MQTPISTLRTGDIVRLTNPGDDLEVTDVEPATDFPGMLRVSVAWDGGQSAVFAFFGENMIWAVSQPRTVQVSCMLCHGTYPYDVDLATSVLVASIRGICGPCNDRTTAAVLKESSS